MANLIRSFIALPIAQPIKNNIGTLINELQKINSYKSIRWVDIKNIHITLKFLGETDFGKLSTLATRLEKASESIQQFEVIYSSTGFFPSMRFPKIFWVGCQINEQLSNLFKIVEEICILNNFAPEGKPISPHITIGRIKNQVDTFDTNEFRENFVKYKNVDFGTQAIKNFILYKSELTPNGPIYTPLNEFNLKV